MTTYQDYLNAIVQFYNEQKTMAGFPQGLLNPTRAKIRDECREACTNRFRNADIPILRHFFKGDSQSEILKAINQIDLDKLRPLENFLWNGTGSTRDKNIELLGWLIDFPERPSDRYIQARKQEQETGESENTGQPDQPTQKAANDPWGEDPRLPKQKESGSATNTVGREENKLGQISNPVSLSFRKRMLMAVIAILMAAGVGYWFLRGQNRPTKCMRWTGDYYEAVSCDSLVSNKMVVPLNEDALHNLRRVRRPDTIKKENRELYWYAKRGTDSVDVFTDGGKDPARNRKSLIPLSDHIYRKHVLHIIP